MMIPELQCSKLENHEGHEWRNYNVDTMTYEAVWCDGRKIKSVVSDYDPKTNGYKFEFLDDLGLTVKSIILTRKELVMIDVHMKQLDNQLGNSFHAKQCGNYEGHDAHIYDKERNGLDANYICYGRDERGNDSEMWADKLAEVIYNWKNND